VNPLAKRLFIACEDGEVEAATCKTGDVEAVTRQLELALLVPVLMTLDETFDVGVDTRTPVDDNDYQVPFRFTGKLNKLTFKLGPTQLTHALAKARD
jgi:hypothetical protein